MTKLTGIILAGGKSSRMGTDKGMIDFKGKKLIEYAIEIISSLVDDIIIIANENSYSSLGYKVFKDSIKEIGPLGGIITALQNTNTEKNIILSCDMPFVNKGLLQYLINKSEGFDITVPIHNNRTEQLLGVYSKTCLKTFLAQAEKNNLALHQANDLMNINKVAINERCDFWTANLFDNLNNPEDLLNTM